MANENNEDKVTPNSSDVNNEGKNADSIDSTEESKMELSPEEVETPESSESQQEDTVGKGKDKEIDIILNELGNPESDEEPGTEVSEEEQVIPEESVAEDSPGDNTEAMSTLKTTKDSSANDKNIPLDQTVAKREQELLVENKSLKQEVEDLRKQIEVKDNELRNKAQEIEKSQEKIANKDQEIEELKKENEAKEQEIKQLKDPLLMLINKKLKEQENDLKEDHQELANYSKQVNKWTIRNQNLQKGINYVVETSNEILFQSRETKDKLPETLREKLQKRQEGLNLIGKMLTRLQEQINVKIEKTSEPEQLQIASEQELRDLLNSEPDEKLGQKAIAKKLKEVGTQRWKIISQQRDLAEKLRKKWLNIIDKKILPILDGIDDGKKFSDNLIQQLKAENPEQATELDNWFGTYGLLQEMFLKMLESVKVYPMKVPIGQQIDYNLHEPFDVQPDPELNNEDIKEVTRQGYEYKPETEGQELMVLRSAQVVVVKNN
ncbi:MAG: nucleotide exchange factor GrpE [Xenococcus sp. (in: cyanobacteria)]